MNRTIKFRGKAYYSYAWIYGTMIEIDGRRFIFEANDPEAEYIENTDPESDVSYLRGLCEVVFDTVGQFTGLQDKNGRDIYEGDILEGEDALARGIVIWKLDGFCIHEIATDWTIFRAGTYHREAYIIGNIYDNPELLK